MIIGWVGVPLRCHLSSVYFCETLGCDAFLAQRFHFLTSLKRELSTTTAFTFGWRLLALCLFQEYRKMALPGPWQLSKGLQKVPRRRIKCSKLIRREPIQSKSSIGHKCYIQIKIEKARCKSRNHVCFLRSIYLPLHLKQYCDDLLPVNCH